MPVKWEIFPKALRHSHWEFKSSSGQTHWIQFIGHRSYVYVLDTSKGSASLLSFCVWKMTWMFPWVVTKRTIWGSGKTRLKSFNSPLKSVWCQGAQIHPQHLLQKFFRLLLRAVYCMALAVLFWSNNRSTFQLICLGWKLALKWWKHYYNKKGHHLCQQLNHII